MLTETLKDRLKQAMFAKNEVEKNILRVIISEVGAVENSSNQAGKPVSDEQVHKILRKTMQSNIETLAHGPANAAVLTKENEIMNALLPNLLSIDDIRAKLAPIADEIKSAEKSGAAVGIAIKFFKTSGDAVDGNSVKTVVEEIRNV